MSQRAHKFIFVLAVAAIALPAFTTTADLLPHHHDNLNERVCPICHPPLMGLQRAAVKLPSLSLHSWATNIYVYRFVMAAPILCSIAPLPSAALRGSR